MGEDLRDALVELTAPDGRSFQFRYGATIPYAGQDYVVLVEMEKDLTGQEQILVTRVEEEDGQLSFVVAEEEDIVSTVFEKYLALSLQQQLDQEECCCDHDHGDCCGHHHQDCDCQETE